MPFATVYLVPSIPASINYKPYYATLDHRPLLGAFFEWLHHVAPSPDLAMVCYGEYDREFLLSLASRFHVRLIESPYRSPGLSLLSALDILDANDLAVVDIGLCLAPPSLLRHVVHCHLSSSSDFTEVIDLPTGARPAIYSRALLARAASFLQSGWSLGWGLLIRKALSTPNPPLRATPFRFAPSLPGQPAARYPSSVDLSSHDALAAARPLLLEILSSSNSASLAESLVPRVAHALLKYRERLSQQTEKNYADLLHQNTRPHLQPSPPCHILFYSAMSTYSGGEESLIRLASALDHSQYKLSAIIPQEGLFSRRMRDLGVHVICPNRELNSPSAYNLLYLSRLIGELNPSLIHFNGLSGPLSIQCAALSGLPVVQHVRNANAAAYGEQLQVASAIISVSDFIRQCLRQADVPDSRIHVIYDGIDLARFDPRLFDKRAARLHLGLPLDVPLVLMTGRFVPYKRHDLVIEAFTLVRSRIPAAHLVLVGETSAQAPSVRDQVLAAIARSSLSTAVTFLPFQEDIRWVEAAADVQVLVSDSEPLGTCILEAMAMELPVIISDSGGLAEVVIDGQSGYVIPGGNSSVLADRLIHLLSSEQIRRAIGQAARQRIGNIASIQLCAQKTSALYQALTRSAYSCQVGPANDHPQAIFD
jgi:glycosyltransferase involved in cell wall biosynthesis